MSPLPNHECILIVDAEPAKLKLLDKIYYSARITRPWYRPNNTRGQKKLGTTFILSLT